MADTLKMPVGRIFPLLVRKVERKGFSAVEVYSAFSRLTGWTEEDVASNSDMPYGDFLMASPAWSPLAENVKGSVCGVKVEEVEDSVMRRARVFDKIVDDIAKGRKKLQI